MSIMFWDLTLLGVFLVFVSSFLIIERKKIKREGLLFLYHSKWGINLIDKIGKKHERFLKFLSYLSVFVGYILMIAMVYLFAKILVVYLFQADLVRAIKIPPITPLIPYLPQIFKLDFLPPFYFSYWIIILAIVAITHEFFHGIFAKISKVRTKTTGFGFFPFFLPIFLAAFVNLDEKTMEKRSNFEQMAVLSAGTFANILTAILGVFLMWGFFSLAFSPAGVMYDDYAYGFVDSAHITSINGINLTNPTYETLVNLTIPGNLNKILVGDEIFLGIKGISTDGEIALYYDSPAIRNGLSGAITKINGENIRSLDDLSRVISSHEVGENITVLTYNGSGYSEIILTVGNSPDGKPWLGVNFLNTKASGILGTVSAFTTSYKNNHIYYSPNFPAAKFIYDLFWWFVLISFSVALVNMLPVGIFDGGRFFYLTILSVTKSKKIAENSFKIMTAIFLALLVLLMFFWAKSFI